MTDFFAAHCLHRAKDRRYEVLRRLPLQLTPKDVEFMAHHGKLAAIDAGLFCEGMCIQTGIYYYNKGSCVLLCKNVCMTLDLIDRLQQAAKTHDGIFIEEKYYEDVWNESLRIYSQKTDQIINEQYELMIEHGQRIFEKHEAIAAEVFSLLEDVVLHSQLSLSKSELIAQNIADDLCEMDDSLVLNCINQIRAADDYLYLHCVNVAALNGLIGRWMELAQDQIVKLIKIGLLHDVGKLKISPKILSKPGKLTPKEFAEIKQHPIYSYDILCNSGEQDEVVLSAVRAHHEQPNGTGYPDGLSSDSIPLFAAITTVSDVYDAMVSERCYKDASTPFEVLGLFYENQFSTLDPRIVAVFLKYISYMLVGKNVRLSTQESGKVIYVSPSNYAHPIVRVKDRIVVTDDRCKCVAIIDERPFESSKPLCNST